MRTPTAHQATAHRAAAARAPAAGFVRHVAAIAAAAAFGLAACAPHRTAELPEGRPADRPLHGGELNVGTVYVTLSALSWDPADWTWKGNHDAGLVREQLFAADLDQSASRGGSVRFVTDAYLPAHAIRGELAESWEWEDSLTIAIHLRPGVRFPAVPGVMEARELVADDVVYTFHYINDSPRRIPTYFDHVASVEARGDRTVVFRFNTFNAEWDYRFGYGYYSGIIPRELAAVDQRDWRNVTGSGPFTLTRYIAGHVMEYQRNPDYWGRETFGGEPVALPFVDRIVQRIIRDEATYLTALRTGRLDILETVRWIAVDHLRKSSPELQWHRWLSSQGTFISLRTDRPPLDDVRVRRALNLALDQAEIVSLFYGGHAELMAFPQHPEYGEYFQPLEEMPASVRELFGYDPDQARALLAEAGYPNGFDITVQVCTCAIDHLDLLPLIEDYWARIGVRMTIQPMEYAAFLSSMTLRTHTAGYMMNSGHVNPFTTIRKNFMTGQTWNPSMYSDPDYDERIREMYRTRDEAERIRIARELTIEILDRAPYVWLPTQYYYTAWWPWVRNYGGELFAGAVRPGPIYTRVWIDQELKRELGFR